MRRIRQQPGETLQKYIQRFNSVCLKIPKVTDEAIISAFSDGVRDVKMKEGLAIHEELCTSLELFNLATKCARAEEGRLSLLELPAANPKEKKSKANRPFCAFHNVHIHNTNDYQELRAICDGRFGRRPECYD